MIYLTAWLYVVGIGPTYFMVERVNGPRWSTRVVLMTMIVWPLYATLCTAGILVALCQHAYKTLWRHV